MASDRSATVIAEARTLLFVPGDRPDRFAKALATCADMVIVDLEDAVAPANKAAARSAVAEQVLADPRLLVRVNAMNTPWFDQDLALCRNKGLAVMLPKAVPGETLTRVAQQFMTLALIETSAGVTGASLVAATPGVVRIALGAIDLALDMDIDVEDEALDPIRLMLTAASRAAGRPGPIDGVATIFNDPAPVHASMARVRRLGFTGKLCIHPAQIDPVLAALQPSPEAVEDARRLVEADRASGGAAVALGGQMVDRPLVERARLLLRRAGQ